MSVGEKSVKTSSADSGSSQNYNTDYYAASHSFVDGKSYSRPVLVISCYFFLFGKLEDALLEHKLRIGRTHGVDGRFQQRLQTM